MQIGEHSALPEVLAQIHSDRNATVVFNGGTYELQGQDVTDTRAQALQYITGLAAQIVGGPVQVALTDPDGTGWRLVVTPNGDVTEEVPAPRGNVAEYPTQPLDMVPPNESAGDAAPEHTLPGQGRATPEDSGASAPSAHSASGTSAASGTPAAPVPTSDAYPAAFAPPAGSPPPGSVAHAFRGPAPEHTDQQAHPHPAHLQPPPGPQPGHAYGYQGDPGFPPAAQQIPPMGPGQPGFGHAPPHPGMPPAPAHVAPGHPEGEQGPRRRELRESFLRTEQAESPATQGVRGALTKMGIRTSPSPAERAERADVNAVSQHWPGVRTIAVVNGKGGANKTPTTALLAAIFARHSGSATLAWDNNETRGTLGWRTEQGKHEATVQDLLPEGQALLDPAAKAGDISHFVHHQAADKYDVLRSNPNVLSAEQRITGDDVDLVHDVAGRYYRLIFIDSGNDESADHWLRMIDKADQLVVATIAKPEHAEAGALLLEALAQRDEHGAQLARNAVVVVSQAREKDTNPSARDIADGFTGWVREVVTIPYDRAMVESVLRFDSLDADTRRAWLRAGAAVAAGL